MNQTYEYKTGKHHHNFNKVKDPTNWKNPTRIKVVKTELEARAIADAVVYFTGCVPEIEELAGRYVVWNVEGYYVVIGA